MGPTSHIKHARYFNTWGTRRHYSGADNARAFQTARENAAKTGAARRAARSVPAAWEK